MKIVKKFEKIIIGLGLIVAIILLTMDIILRTVGTPSNWGEEGIRYIMVWVTFIGASLCFADNSHFRLELFSNIKNKKILRYIDVFIHICSLIFSVLLIYFGTSFVKFAFQSQQITASLRMPIWIVYLCVPISGLTSMFHILDNMNIFKRKDIK